METEVRGAGPFGEESGNLLPPDRLCIRLFGGFAAERNGIPLPRTRSRTEMWLLAVLAVRANREVERSWLAGLFWPESREDQALYNLRRSLSNLRQVLGEDAFRLVSPNSRIIALDLADAFCDVTAFDTVLARKDRASLRRAVTLYGGPLLPDCAVAWIEQERRAREQAFLSALETLAVEAMRDGNADEASRLLRRVLSAEPLREPAHRALLEALAAAGDRAGLMLAYRELRLRLHDELQTEPSGETKALYQRLQDTLGERGAKSAVAKPAEPSPPVVRRLPVPLTSLIGRTEEVAAITALLHKTRLVTLVGTGGIGKTRLALQVAEAHVTAFPDGACFVALAPLSQPNQIVPELLTALGLREADYRPAIDTLCDFLCGQRMLLVIDNCEHLVEEAAHVAESLLTRCPRLHLLATSREALRLSGEQTYRVPSLPVPDAREVSVQGADIPSLLAYPSVHLFTERATAVSRTFALNEENAGAVAMICRRLDGLPLALELAAGRIPVLTAQQIAARLEDRFALLTGGSRTALPRQRTLRAALAWSYDLLSAPERTLLQRLSVFAGSFGVDAARVVTAPLPDFTDHLFSLVEKSLVTAEEKNGEVCYALLETIREFAGAHLTASGELGDVRTRHREYYRTWAEAVERELRFKEPSQWGSLFDAEHDNLRQALRFCQEDPAGGEAGLQLAGVLAIFWDLRGYLSEGRKLLHTALSHPAAQEPNAARANALHRAGELAWAQGDYDAAGPLCEEALTIYREQANTAGIARTLGSLGDLKRDQGDYASARALYTEELQLYRELEDRHGIGSSLLRLAILTRYHGDLLTARSQFEESLTLLREFGDRQDIALALNGLGNLHRHQGDFAAARTLYEESLALRRELGFKPGIAATLNSLGNLALDQKDYRSARTLYAESLALQTEMSNRSGIAYALESLGRAAYAEGDVIAGRSLCWQALAHFRELGDQSGIVGTLRGLAEQALDQGENESARTLLSECLQRSVALEDRHSVTAVLNAFVTLSAREGQAERAVRLWGAWDALREAQGIFLPDEVRQKHEAELSPIRQVLGEESCAQLRESGRAMTWKQAAAFALDGTPE